MIKTAVLKRDDGLEQLQTAIGMTPELVKRFVKKDLQPFTQGLVTRYLRKEPAAVHYPIEWTSDKQRKAFFATDGFGGGIPTKRTHDLVHDWHVLVAIENALIAISVYNGSDEARYVYGDDTGEHQQWFHQNTGWPRFVEAAQIITLAVSNRFEERAPNVIAAALEGSLNL
jgi:hypothetical protein